MVSGKIVCADRWRCRLSSRCHTAASTCERKLARNSPERPYSSLSPAWPVKTARARRVWPRRWLSTQPVRGVCQLTLVVGEEPGEDAISAVTPTRFRASVKAGQHARFDTGEGKELTFYCAQSATAMSVETMQQTAYTPQR